MGELSRPRCPRKRHLMIRMINQKGERCLRKALSSTVGNNTRLLVQCMPRWFAELRRIQLMWPEAACWDNAHTTWHVKAAIVSVIIVVVFYESITWKLWSNFENRKTQRTNFGQFEESTVTKHDSFWGLYYVLEFALHIVKPKDVLPTISTPFVQARFNLSSCFNTKKHSFCARNALKKMHEN